MTFVSMLLLATIALHLPSTHSFAIPTTRNNGHSMVPSLDTTITTPRMIHTNTISFTKLHAKEKDSNDGSVNRPPSPPLLGPTEATILAVAGVLASNVMFYSESVLFRTGCGLPAGPSGVVGAVEGVSYLLEVGLAGFSIYAKVTGGKGLPPGPKGILLAATRLSYLAVFAGILVLIAQVVNFGFIPNMVPMEGAMCK